MSTPYYEHNGITIYHGDCLEILPELGPVDLLLSDPPYGANNNCDYTRFSGGQHESRRYCLNIKGDDKPFDPSPFVDFPEVILWGFNFFSDKLEPGTILIWCKKRDNQLC